MGRRLIGGALVGFGLIAASLAWVCLSITRTVLDPGRSDAIATEVYQDPEVRAYLKRSMASALDAALPDSIDVSRVELADAADRALHDPAVEELVFGGLVRSHQRFLGADPDPDEPIVVDGAALAAATRTELVNARPELVSVIPEIPSLAVTLPTGSLPNAGGLRTRLIAATALLATAAAGLVVAAFVVTNRRARILRRVGFWLIGAAAFWVIVGTALPALAHLLLPDDAAIVAAIWGVAAGGMRQPSINAGVAGVAALVLSVVWMAGSAIAARSGRKVETGSGRRRRAAPAEADGWPRDEPVRSDEPVPADRVLTYEPPRRPTGTPRPPYPTGPTTSPTPTVSSPAPPRSSPPGPSAPEWVEGVGYVDDPDATRY